MRLPLTLAVVFAAALAVAPASAQRGGYANAAHGFSIQPPKGWVQLPALDERGQLVVQWCADRSLSPRATAGRPHTPTLRVYALDGTAPESDEVDGLRRLTPFRSVDDYVERQYGGRARYDSREAVEIDGASGRRYTIDVALDAGSRRLFGLAVTRGDQTLLAEYEVLADYADKNTKEALRTLASLSLSEPAGEANARAPWLVDAAAWQPLESAARRKQIEPWAEALVAAAKEQPGAGWKEYRSKHWTVLAAGKAGDVKKALKAAEQARAWVEKAFADVGSGGTMPAVLRIYASPDHLQAAQERLVDARDFEPRLRTLHFAIDPNAGTGSGYGSLCRAVAWHWIEDHVPGAMRATPRWLDLGMWEYLRSTRIKGRKVEFLASDVETGRLEYQKRNNSMPAIWNLVQESIQPEPEDGAAEDPWGYTPECSKLMRWLLDGDGATVFGKPKFLGDYFQAIGKSLVKVGANPTADVAWTLLNDEQTKAANEKFYEWRKFIRDNANFLVIPIEADAWVPINEKWVAFATGSR